MEPGEEKKRMNNQLRHVSGRSVLGAKIMARVATGAAVFCLIISSLMIINHLQVKSSDPLNDPYIENLKKDLEKNPDDTEARQKIRTLDLYARKAFFTSRHMLKTGGYLLLAGVFVLIASTRVYFELKRLLPCPGREPPRREKFGTAENRGLLAGGAVLVLSALAIAFIPGVETGQEKKPPAPVPVVDVPQDSWTCFRGPMGQGKSYSKTAPLNWDVKQGRNIIWKLELPEKGDNSPVIWEDKIFLSAATSNTITILCIDREKGAILWRKDRGDIPEASTPLPEVMENVGHVASTMAVDRKGLYAIFSSGDVVCLDYDSNIRWVRKFGPIHNPYGHSSSLITWNDRLYVQIDEEEEKGNVYALDCESGKTVWNASRKLRPCWATPMIAITATRTELVVNGSPHVKGYDPVTGKELWSAECMKGNVEVAPSPSYEEGIVFLANEYAKAMALDIQTAPGQPVELWGHDDDLPDVSSILAVNGLAFVPSYYGVVTCYDAKTGEKYWQQEYDKGFYSSPVYAAGNVYLSDMEGTTYVIAAEKEYRLIAESKLEEKIMATPAITGGRMYLRGLRHLYCIGTE